MRAPRVCKARDLYLGRAFSDAKQSATEVAGDLYVVSAGLGLVFGDDLVPPYDVTIATGPGSLLPVLSAVGANAADWWDELRAVGPAKVSLSDLVERTPADMVLVALPGSYVSMVHRDLGRLDRESMRRLRILTSVRGRELLPSPLREAALPYDERLEGSAYAGTRSDFAQRALRHFVEAVRGHQLPLAEARRAVEAAMVGMQRPLVPQRAKQSDAQIEALLRKYWKQHGGSSTRLLRFLRDEKLVACEQSRFRTLWRRLHAAQEGRG